MVMEMEVQGYQAISQHHRFMTLGSMAAINQLFKSIGNARELHTNALEEVRAAMFALYQESFNPNAVLGSIESGYIMEQDGSLTWAVTLEEVRIGIYKLNGWVDTFKTVGVAPDVFAKVNAVKAKLTAVQTTLNAASLLGSPECPLTSTIEE